MQARLVELAEAQALGLLFGAAARAPDFALALAVLLLTAASSRLLGWAATGLGRRIGVRQGRSDVLRMLLSVAVWIGGLLLAAAVLFPSIAAADILAALGLASVAVGVAFRDIFQNFFAGVLILLREPFRIGDYIHSGELEGQVEHITMRDSRIRRTDGQLMIAPNHSLLQSAVTVRTSQGVRRTAIEVTVAYGADADRAREVIADAVRRVDSVRDDVRDVQVFARALGDDGVVFEIAWWTGSRPVDIRASRDQVARAVKRALDAAGVEIPFPQRTLTLSDSAEAALRGTSSRAAE